MTNSLSLLQATLADRYSIERELDTARVRRPSEAPRFNAPDFNPRGAAAVVPKIAWPREHERCADLLEAWHASATRMPNALSLLLWLDSLQSEVNQVRAEVARLMEEPHSGESQ